jgi:hypothetical protein
MPRLTDTQLMILSTGAENSGSERVCTIHNVQIPGAQPTLLNYRSSVHQTCSTGATRSPCTTEH